MADSEEQHKKTWRMAPHFHGSRYVSGAPFVVVDACSSSLPVLGEGFLGLDLPEGTTPERAREIIDFLQENIRFITYTGPTRPPGITEIKRTIVDPRAPHEHTDQELTTIIHAGQEPGSLH